MRIRYSFRTEKDDLPNDKILIATTIQIHQEFADDHNAAWERYGPWIKPMNSLEPGLFFSINYDSEEFPFSTVEMESDKHYTTVLGKNYVKIYFQHSDALPYKIVGYTVNLFIIQICQRNTTKPDLTNTQADPSQSQH